MLLSRIIVAGTLLAGSLAEAAARPAGPSARKVCEGERETGSGMAGTVVGECSLRADTDPERMVQDACESGATCRLEAMVDRRGNVVKVLSVRQLRMAVKEAESYLERLGGHLNGILAPASAGCENPQDSTEDRVSVLLSGLVGPTIQQHGRFCAVTSGTGDDNLDGPYEAVLRANCGPIGAADGDLRTGRSGTKTEIRISKAASGPLKIDGEPLVFCRIRRSYTPQWWIDGNYTFRGKYPD